MIAQLAIPIPCMPQLDNHCRVYINVDRGRGVHCRINRVIDGVVVMRRDGYAQANELRLPADEVSIPACDLAQSARALEPVEGYVWFVPSNVCRPI